MGGANVTDLRGALSWATPSLTTALPTTPGTDAPTGGEHAGHHDGTAATSQDPGGLDQALFDEVLTVARTVNVNTGLVEMRPPKQDGEAWTVTGIQHSYPTEVDAVAIDPKTLEVTDRIDFADFPVPAKLARRGIDIHMGTMFGLLNQLVLAGVALAIAAMVALGYRMWWQRRPTTTPRLPGPTPAVALTRAPWWGIGLIIVIGAAIGTFLPHVGAGLIGFILFDVLVSTARAHRRR